MKTKKLAVLAGTAAFATAVAWPVQAEMTVNVGGRIQVDAALYDDDETDLGDGTEFRRVRLFADGTIDEAWKYKVQIDFADNDLDGKDIFIQHTSGLKIGQFKAPFGLEELTSSKYVTFMERSMAMEAFAPSRKIGIGWGTKGDQWTLNVMGHGQNASSQEAPADEGWGAAGRVTWAAIQNDDQVLHFGGAVSWEQPANGDSEDIRLRVRPESHVTNQRLVDTGTIEGVDYETRFGLEAAWVWNSFYVQGEYVFDTAECDDACVSGGTPTTDDSYDFSAWYAYAGWISGGNKRAYKDGKFERTKAKNAWEIAGRYSYIDLQDGDIDGGEQTNLTLGINYYVSPYLRFMFNYVYVDDIDGGPRDGENPSVFQVRAAMDFK